MINTVMAIIITIRQLCNLGEKIIKTIPQIHGSTLTGATDADHADTAVHTEWDYHIKFRRLARPVI